MKVRPSFTAPRIANVGCTTQAQAASSPAYHSNEAPRKTITAAAPVMRCDEHAPKRSQVRGAPLVLVVGVVEAALPVVGDGDGDGDGDVSPFELDTFPRIELAKAHTWRMLFTSEGRSGVSRTAVWFVFSKQSTHCGKTDWKVSVQEHSITSRNAPGLKRTEEKLAMTGAAWAQELMLG